MDASVTSREDVVDQIVAWGIASVRKGRYQLNSAHCPGFALTANVLIGLAPTGPYEQFLQLSPPLS